VALAQRDQIYFVPAVFWGGVANCVTGYLWDAPMPVQPMNTLPSAGVRGCVLRLGPVQNRVV